VSDDKAKPRGLFGRLFGGKTAEPAETVEVEAATPVPDDVASEPETVEATAVAAGQSDAGKKATWFQRLKSGLAKTSSKLSEGITGVFTKRKLTADTLEDLEDLLIQADLGVETAGRITATLSKGRYEKGIAPDDVRAVLAAEVERVLIPVAQPLVLSGGHKPEVILFVGVNGTGKTTTIGKLAARFGREGKSVMMAAGDTFRAAAIEQLKIGGGRRRCRRSCVRCADRRPGSRH
jgi:fused signal recognition particle receptor